VFEVTVGAHEIGDSYELTIDEIPEYNNTPELKDHPEDRYSSTGKSHLDHFSADNSNLFKMPSSNLFSLSSPLGQESPFGMFASYLT